MNKYPPSLAVLTPFFHQTEKKCDFFGIDKENTSCKDWEVFVMKMVARLPDPLQMNAYIGDAGEYTALHDVADGVVDGVVW